MICLTAVVNTARSCGWLEIRSNCMMNSGWLNYIHKTRNYAVWHDSLSVSDTGKWVHLNSHTCIDWLKIPSTEYFTFICHFFQKLTRKLELILASAVFSPLPTAFTAWGTRRGGCLTTVATKCWLRQHNLRLPVSATDGNWRFFLEWRSQTQLCATLPLLLLRVSGESGP